MIVRLTDADALVDNDAVTLRLPLLLVEPLRLNEVEPDRETLWENDGRRDSVTELLREPLRLWVAVPVLDADSDRDLDGDRVRVRDRDVVGVGGMVYTSRKRGRRVEGVRGRQSQKLMLFGLSGKPVKCTNVQ